MECPFGHKVGIDTDNHDECFDKCDDELANKCFKLKTELKKLKNNSELQDGSEI